MVRLRLEIALSVLSGGLAVLTAVSPEWIEILTGLEPDAGNGTLEWIIVLSFAALAVILGFVARHDLRLIRSRRMSQAPSEVVR